MALGGRENERFEKDLPAAAGQLPGRRLGNHPGRGAALHPPREGPGGGGRGPGRFYRGGGTGSGAARCERRRPVRGHRDLPPLPAGGWRRISLFRRSKGGLQRHLSGGSQGAPPAGAAGTDPHRSCGAFALVVSNLSGSGPVGTHTLLSIPRAGLGRAGDSEKADLGPPMGVPPVREKPARLGGTLLPQTNLRRPMPPLRTSPGGPLHSGNGG